MCCWHRRSVFILGFIFKENCPDVYNTKVIDIIDALKEYKTHIVVFDPWINDGVTQKEYGVIICKSIFEEKYDAIILAVAHEEFKKINISSLLFIKGVVFDMKGFLNKQIIDGKL